jgi:hypothetical protein
VKLYSEEGEGGRGDRYERTPLTAFTTAGVIGLSALLWGNDPHAPNVIGDPSGHDSVVGFKPI